MRPLTNIRHGAAKSEFTAKGISDEERAGLYDPSFMANLTPALSYLQDKGINCLLYTSPSPRDGLLSRMPSSA